MDIRFSAQFAGFLAERNEKLLPPLLAATVANIARFDAWRMMTVDFDGAVSVVDLRNNLRTENDKRGANLTADPIHRVAQKDVGDGFYSSEELAPRGLSKTHYHEQALQHGLILSDHAGFVAKVSDEQSICLSFSRSDQFSMLTKTENEKFRASSPLVIHVLKRIWNKRTPDAAVGSNDQKSSTKDLQELVLQSFGFTTLSPRERDVAKLLFSGHSAKMIAKILDIGPGTVRNHIKHIYLKLDLSSAVSKTDSL